MINVFLSESAKLAGPNVMRQRPSPTISGAGDAEAPSLVKSRTWDETHTRDHPAAGHRMVHLVDPEDMGLLHFEETGESPEGMDFAVQWNGVWLEGRCYDSYPERTFVRYKDAQRLSLRAGMQASMPLYILNIECLLELARASVHELGYILTQEDTIVGSKVAITSRECMQVAVPVGNERSLVVMTITLRSSGDIHLVAESETFLTPGSFV